MVVVWLLDDRRKFHVFDRTVCSHRSHIHSHRSQVHFWWIPRGLQNWIHAIGKVLDVFQISQQISMVSTTSRTKIDIIQIEFLIADPKFFCCHLPVLPAARTVPAPSCGNSCNHTHLLEIQNIRDLSDLPQWVMRADLILIRWHLQHYFAGRIWTKFSVA